jgi:NCS1 family nucleobase:cation symporter-1
MDGPFPVDGIVPLLKPLYDYSWFAAAIIAFVIYWVLAVVVKEKGQEVE